MSNNKIIIIFGLLLCVSTGHAMYKFFLIQTCDGYTYHLPGDVVKEFPTLNDALKGADQADNLPIKLSKITSRTMNTLWRILGCDCNFNYISLSSDRARRFNMQSRDSVTKENIESSIDCLNAASFLQNPVLKQGYIRLLAPFFASDEFFEYVANKNSTYTQYLDDRIPKDLLSAFTLSMQVWKQKKKIECPEEKGITALAVYADGKKLAVGSSKKTYIYDETGAQLYRIPKGFGHTNWLAISGNMLAIGAEDNTLSLYDLNQNERRSFITLSGYVRSLAFSPDNKIWVGLGDCSVQRINPENMRIELTLLDLSEVVTCIACSLDGSKVAYSMDTDSYIIDPATGKVRHKVATGDLHRLAFSPNSQWLVAGDSNGKLTVIDPSTGKTDKSFCLRDDTIQSIQFLPNNNTMIAVGYSSGHVHLIDLSTGDCRLLRTENTSDSLRGFAWHSDGRIFVRAYADHLSIDERITNSLQDSLLARYHAWVCKNSLKGV